MRVVEDGIEVESVVLLEDVHVTLHERPEVLGHRARVDETQPARTEVDVPFVEVPGTPNHDPCLERRRGSLFSEVLGEDVRSEAEPHAVQRCVRREMRDVRECATQVVLQQGVRQAQSLI